MKHTWIIIVKSLTIMCATCGMEREDWKKSGKPPCRGRLPIPEEPDYHNYV